MKGAEKHERTIAELLSDLEAGHTSSAQLVDMYLGRIASLDPKLNSVLALNPEAPAEAAARDRERHEKRLKGPLHGIPLLIKDNIETADPVPTTAGSLALKDNLTRRDAPCIARLRAAGAIVLGKTNLSEWANIRASRSVSGWSALGGLTRNPFVLDRSTSGSSSGSAAAVAASFAAGAIGTETDGSITSPASLCGIVGLKPTLGLVSRTHIVPIAASQDTAGPMTRSVRDAALLLAAMSGRDPADDATASADRRRENYVGALSDQALANSRLGVWRPHRAPPATLAVFDSALAILGRSGAELVPLDGFRPPKDLVSLELQVLLHELKDGLNGYLATAAKAVQARTLADVIAFNRHNDRELVLFGQDFFDAAEATHGLSDPSYKRARAASRRMARRTLTRALDGEHLDAIISVTSTPAERIDLVRGDDNSVASTTLPAIAGYPHLSVPMGNVDGLPVGLSFIGRAWSEARILSLGHAFECAADRRLIPKFLPSIEGGREKDFERL